MKVVELSQKLTDFQSTIREFKQKEKYWELERQELIGRIEILEQNDLKLKTPGSFPYISPKQPTQKLDSLSDQVGKLKETNVFVMEELEKLKGEFKPPLLQNRPSSSTGKISISAERNVRRGTMSPSKIQLTLRKHIMTHPVETTTAPPEVKQDDANNNSSEDDVFTRTLSLNLVYCLTGL